MIVFSRYYVLGVCVLVFLIPDGKLRADIDSFKLYFIVDFILSQYGDFISSSVKLSKSSGLYLVDLNLWFDTLVIASLGLSVGTAGFLGPSLGIIQVRYLL